MLFLKGGRHLWTPFSQSFSDKNEKFLCSSERKFPELFKTHPTFVYSPFLVPSMAFQTQRGVFFWDTLYILFKKVKDWNLENEVRMNLRSGSEEFDMKTVSLFRIQNPNLIRIDPPLSSLSGWMDVVMCIMSRVPVECVIYCEEDRPRLQASDWPQLITWPQYWLLIGQFSCHKVVSLADRVQRWTDDPDFSPLPHILKSGPALANQRAWSAILWPMRGPDGLVCRTFPCRFVTLGLTPAPDQGDPNTINPGIVRGSLNYL